MRDLAVGRELGSRASVGEAGEEVECIFDGVSEEQIVLEDKARTTVENAFLIRERLEHLHISEMTLITCDFHMRRAHYIFQEVMDAALGPESLGGLEKVLR